MDKGVSMMNLVTDDFYSIVTENIPLIDVRAPIEFEKGAFIQSINLPIMDDEERRLVGTCYKQNGNEEAVKLGYQLVSGEIKKARVEAWTTYLDKYPDAYIYCFRGGSRSRITQEWIKEATGKQVARLDGGYKAFRNYLIEQLDPSKQTSIPVVLGGHTGSGKTILLNQLPNVIDLEKIANHRGSAFGQHVTKQPTQINFENNLAYALIKHKAKGYKHMIVEDEGRHVGSSFIPNLLAGYFNSGGLIVLEVPLEERVIITLDEYVTNAQQEYIHQYQDKELGMEKWYEYIITSIKKLRKRLGGDRLKAVLDLFEQACKMQLETGDNSKHQEWIYLFLKEYYDPMYEYQLKTTTKRILFRGNQKEVLGYLQSLD